jgi:hypothetical protein
MEIKFILFTIFLEKFSKWSNFKITKSQNEYIIDFAYLRIYVY